VLADEPTGNLDSRAADAIAQLLRQVADEWGRSVLMVTHDPRIAAYADRIIFLKDGTIVEETRLTTPVAPALAAHDDGLGVRA
jgi:putative ABC transport system ATP-binding protein